MTENIQVSLNKFHRIVWFGLVILAEVVGILTGLAIGVTDFWFSPGAGIMAMGMVLVLAVTTYRLSKEPVERRREEEA